MPEAATGERTGGARVLALGLAVGLPYALLVQRFWFVCDDAFISFRYSRNWALGHGPRYNLGDGAPVEGYSNFLWMAIGAVVERLGGDISFWMPLLSFVLGGLLLVHFSKTLIRYFDVDVEVATLSTLALACFPPFAVWSTGGLATMAQTLLTFVLYERLVLSRDRWSGVGAGLAAAALALVRAEGIAWVVVLLILGTGARLLSRENVSLRRRLAPVAVTAAMVAVIFTAYYAWRYDYYGTLVANTALVKVSFGLEKLLRGISYVTGFFLAFVTPVVFLACGPAAIRRGGVPAAVAFTMAVAPPTYSAVVGGDYMTMGRMILAGIPFSILLLALALDTAWKNRLDRRGEVALFAALVIAIGLLPASNIHIVPLSVREYFHFRHNREDVLSELEQWEKMDANAKHWRLRGMALGQVAGPDDSFVAAAIGAVGYYSNVYMYDRNGLVTREVAELPTFEPADESSPGHEKTVDRDFFLGELPTFLQAKVVYGDNLRRRVRKMVTLPAWKLKGKMKRGWGYDVQPVDLPELGGPAYLVSIRALAPGETADSREITFHDALARVPE